MINDKGQVKNIVAWSERRHSKRPASHSFQMETTLRLRQATNSFLPASPKRAPILCSAGILTITYSYSHT
jgi:hypothetical protein